MKNHFSQGKIISTGGFQFFFSLPLSISPPSHSNELFLTPWGIFNEASYQLFSTVWGIFNEASYELFPTVWGIFNEASHEV